MGLDKFSLALKQGFNQLNQVRSVSGSVGNFRAFVPYITLRDYMEENDTSFIKTYGFMGISEDELDTYKAAAKTHGEPYKSLVRQVEDAFDLAREQGIEATNNNLRLETEKFYQTYVEGEVITQEFRPIQLGQDHLDNLDVPTDETFMHRRGRQQAKENIGRISEISHGNIIRAWDIDS